MAAATNHVGGAVYEHVPTPDVLGAEHVTVAENPVEVSTTALTARPEVLTVQRPSASVSTYVSTRVLRSTKRAGVFRMTAMLAAGLA